MRLRALTTLLAAAALATLTLSGVAGASGGRIGPNQHFVGLVNGKHTGAIIYTVCPGPERQMGHPAGNQTVEALRVASGGGDTGSTGNVIYGYVPGAPPAITQLTRYGAPGAISTSAIVPCGGSGGVYFTSCPLPQPCGAGSKTDDVAVKFENIAT